MVNSQTTSITPATHADRHKHGGADPLTGDVRVDTYMHLDQVINNVIIPAAYTDIDVSTYIKPGQHMLFMKVVCSALSRVTIRPKGDVNEWLTDNVDVTAGAACVYCTAGEAFHMIQVTDANGVIQVKGNNVATVTITLLGYI